MITRAQELCRKLKPVLGRQVDGLWAAYLAESDPGARADVEQTLELLAMKHLGQTYEPDRSPFPPPSKEFAGAGDLPLGNVAYAARELYPFALRSTRLREHLLIAGRSGSGKTNLTFVLLRGIMARGIKVLALDWKRGYRDMLELRPELRVYTIGRDVAPFRFNPFIPPPGCEPHVWIKLIVDVIANAYLGGEGVISLLVAGLDHLYAETGVFDGTQQRWPTVQDLLAWLRTTKLRGRAALWQASAERILLAMTYGEFGAVVNTQDNRHLQDLLNHNVILEMDGLSSSADRVMFSEALTLYLYRYRLVQGPKDQLTNLIVLEEAHNLLLAKQLGTKESMLESSIRMIRQYGLGYVFVDQSASLLSKVAFANSYATLALSQKLRADVQAMAGAMNLTDEQKEALSTLPVGTAIVRLADEHPEPFLIRIPRCPIREGSVSDDAIRARMAACSGGSAADNRTHVELAAVSPIPAPDKTVKMNHSNRTTHPPSPQESHETVPTRPVTCDSSFHPPWTKLTREEQRFLADVAARPLSTTVSRYQRLHLSRRRGNAIRQDLVTARLVESVVIATRSGQVVLYELTELGRAACTAVGIDPGPVPRASLEHRYWVAKAAEQFERRGYEVTQEHAIPGDGVVDVVAERPGERVAIEVETGKSDIAANLSKLHGAAFDRIVLLATSPAAVAPCEREIHRLGDGTGVELQTWLDVS
jgi:energy-coupling factor transporter ATP-binding protein EcfA2